MIAAFVESALSPKDESVAAARILKAFSLTNSCIVVARESKIMPVCLWYSKGG